MEPRHARNRASRPYSGNSGHGIARNARISGMLYIKLCYRIATYNRYVRLVSCKDREECFFSEDCRDGYISYIKGRPHTSRPRVSHLDIFTDVYRSFPWHHQPEVTQLQKVFSQMSDEDREDQKKKVAERDLVSVVLLRLVIIG